MFFHLKDATIFTWRATATFFRFFFFGLVVLFNWSKGFAPVSATYAFFIPKLLIILPGLLVTNIPPWLLVLISFLPLQIIGLIFFIAFILALAQ